MKQTATFAALFITAAIFTFTSCTNNNKAVSQSEIDSLKNQIVTLTAGNESIAKNLVTFDTLDFTVFTNQQWTRLHESHAKDIKVNWPDGHFTTGIDKHIEDLKAMFVYAPDTRVKEHPIRFGSGNYTAVTGVMEGTFTKPMPIGNGKFIPPTGKSFKLPMATIGIWKDGIMVEESLFWDNQTYMNQLGLSK
ncbi:ester cyclase [Ferruginibacter sp. SUN106]|uniref:ester cyclase n=1 Tax=Ferruginibacter sp. SUN106 TaxID=2978348 RepID=UPI003D35A477